MKDGARLGEATGVTLKPLVEIGGMRSCGDVMKIKHDRGLRKITT